MILKNEVAVITGGGRGIGRAIARCFAAEGAAVLVAARSEPEVAKAAAEIRKAGGKAVSIAADVSQEDACERIVRAAEQQLGPVSILVNNAGIHGPVNPVEQISSSEWDEVIAANLRGPFLLTRLVLPGMYARGSGNILNISSISAKTAFPCNSAYAASKAGLLALTRVVAAEAARKGVRVNAVCPGPVFETRMSQDLGRTLSQKLGMDEETQRARFADDILLGRGQTADEIAAVALFLVSDKASSIIGQAVNADGGLVFY